jgi:hypothetical protein
MYTAKRRIQTEILKAVFLSQEITMCRYAFAVVLVCLGAVSVQAADKEINCVIVMQYNPDMEGEDIAKNEDLLGSAEALKVKTGNAEIEKVTSTRKLDTALAAFKSAKKCCKTITIVSHGLTDGAVLMPYDLPDP